MKTIFGLILLAFSALTHAENLSVINLKWDGFAKVAYFDVVTSSSINVEQIYANAKEINSTYKLYSIELAHSNQETEFEAGATLYCIKIDLSKPKNVFRNIVLPTVTKDVWAYGAMNRSKCTDYKEVTVNYKSL